jgi:hypothetical protein
MRKLPPGKHPEHTIAVLEKQQKRRTTMTHATNRWKNEHALILAILSLLLLLTGCTMESETRIGNNEEWENVTTLTFSAETVELMGGVDQLRSDIEDELEDENADYEQSMRLDENSDGSVTYVFTANGQGYDTLNEAVFDGSATIEADDNNQVSIQYDFNSLNIPAFEAVTFKISGSEIVDSNADEVAGGTATWTNPGIIDVTLVSGATGGLPGNITTILLLLAGVLGVILIVVLGGFLIWQQKKRKQNTPA